MLKEACFSPFMVHISGLMGYNEKEFRMFRRQYCMVKINTSDTPVLGCPCKIKGMLWKHCSLVDSMKYVSMPAPYMYTIHQCADSQGGELYPYPTDAIRSEPVSRDRKQVFSGGQLHM